MSKLDNLFNLTKINDPAFLLFGNGHTIMLKGDKSAWILVYSKRKEKEGFIPCTIDLEAKKLTKGDREQFVISETIKEFKESKKLHPGLGSLMSSI